MIEDRLQRRLSALISADVVDYSRLMAEDQIETIRSLKTCRDRITAAVLKFNGRVMDFVGDNMLAECSNARSAADCAVEIHRALAGINRNLALHRRIQLRIGIHLGDVMFDGKQIFGDAVNVAAAWSPILRSAIPWRPGPGGGRSCKMTRMISLTR